MSKVEFCVFYYSEWDYDFMESIDLINEIKETYSDFNIVRRICSSTISGLKNKESFDIIVSTSSMGRVLPGGKLRQLSTKRHGPYVVSSLG